MLSLYKSFFFAKRGGIQHKYTVRDTSFIDKKNTCVTRLRMKRRYYQTTTLYKEIKLKLPVVTEKNNMDILSQKEKKQEVRYALSRFLP